MAELRSACEGDISALKAIWSAVFGDGEDFLAPFFSEIFPLSHAFLALEDGAAAGSAYVLDICSLVRSDGGTAACPYIYAVGVLPEYRGRDIGKELTLRCRDFCRERYGLSCLVPAESGLFDYYSRFAVYAPAFFARTLMVEALPAASCELKRIAAGEYSVRREALLRGSAHMSFDVRALAFIGEVTAPFGFYEVSLGDGRAIMLCEAVEGKLWIKELLCEASDRAESFAAAAAARLGFERCILRAPAEKEHPESAKAFGMLSIEPPEPAYFGPAID